MLATLPCKEQREYIIEYDLTKASVLVVLQFTAVEA